MWEAVVTYFASDALKILYLLGGGGGCWFWFEKWLERIRLRVRLLNHAFDLPGDNVEATIEFEAVNLGKSSTSLEPFITCTGYTPERKRVSGQLSIVEPERLLVPHSTRRLTATGRLDARYPFWLFKTFRISPNRGSDRVLRTRSNPRETIGWLRYELELTLFLWFGALPFMRGDKR